MYRQASEAYSAALQGGRTSLRDQIRNAIIQSGYDIRGRLPSDLGEYGGDIDEATAQTALQNPFSQRALLEQALGTGQSDLGYQLAARGTLRSGALAAGTGGLQQQYQQKQAQQTQDLLNAIRGGATSYADLASQALSTRNQAWENVASRLAQLAGARYQAEAAAAAARRAQEEAGYYGPPTTFAEAYQSGLEDLQRAANRGNLFDLSRVPASKFLSAPPAYKPLPPPPLPKKTTTKKK
jgi:hypothetical protein